MTWKWIVLKRSRRCEGGLGGCKKLIKEGKKAWVSSSTRTSKTRCQECWKKMWIDVE